MIVDGIIRWFAGRVRFAAENGIGERLLNLCAAENISLFGLKRTPEGFQASASARNFVRVEELAEKANLQLTVLSRRGFLFRAARYRRRWGLFLGTVFLLFFLLLAQNMILTVRVEGNRTVASETVLSVLSELGVRRFAMLPGLNLRLKKQEALLRLPQLSWLAINRKGSTLVVSVAERRLPPVIEEKTPCDVVAAKTGLVRYIEVYEGLKQVTANHTVLEGDLLVSGSIPGKQESITRVHASAKVIAEVQFEKTLSLHLEQVTRSYTGEEKNRYRLRIGSFRLPLFLAFPVRGEYEVERQFTPFYLFGLELPFGIETEQFRFYTHSRAPLTLEEGDRILAEQFRRYEASELADSVILDRKTAERLVDGVLYRKVSYLAEENIARQVTLAE